MEYIIGLFLFVPPLFVLIYIYYGLLKKIYAMKYWSTTIAYFNKDAHGNKYERSKNDNVKKIICFYSINEKEYSIELYNVPVDMAQKDTINVYYNPQNPEKSTIENDKKKLYKEITIYFIAIVVITIILAKIILELVGWF